MGNIDTMRLDYSVRHQLALHLPADALAELLRRQIISLKKTMVELETAVQGNESEHVVACAHHLAGAAAMAGFGCLAAAARRLDKPGELTISDSSMDLELLRNEWMATRSAAEQSIE